jgi:hypothetical protein
MNVAGQIDSMTAASSGATTSNTGRRRSRAYYHGPDDGRSTGEEKAILPPVVGVDLCRTSAKFGYVHGRRRILGSPDFDLTVRGCSAHNLLKSLAYMEYGRLWEELSTVFRRIVRDRVPYLPREPSIGMCP